MRTKIIAIGLGASLVLPLAAAYARVATDPGVNQSGSASVGLEQIDGGVASRKGGGRFTDFGRFLGFGHGHDGPRGSRGSHGSNGSKGSKGSKSKSRPR